MTKKVRAKPDTFLYKQRKNRIADQVENDDALCASAAFLAAFSGEASLAPTSGFLKPCPLKHSWFFCPSFVKIRLSQLTLPVFVIKILPTFHFFEFTRFLPT
jgi:hypothetical protein